jgi:two-component system phosphate regulon sensor histidine kinase PhoR
MDLVNLATLIRGQREELLLSWRDQVRELPSAAGLDIPTLNDHMPRLIGEIASALETGSWETIPEAILADNENANPRDSAKIHGLQRLEDEFDIEEVVAEYNILRGCLHDLANANGFTLQGKPFHVINRVFDHAIGLALKSYSNQKALEIKLRREEYLSFVAHDLQTPLMAIALAGRVLERSLPVTQFSTDAAKILKTLRRSVQQLEELVQKVLEENANLHTGSGLRLVRRNFDLWPMIESLIEELQSIADDSSITLVNEVPDDLSVFADAAYLKRVFQNLIGNATKFAPGGRVVIGAGERIDEGVVECWVRDNGPGVSSETLSHLFPMDDSSLDQSENSDCMGLGLSIVRAFTEAHGGTLTLDSKPDEGATFLFSLPLNRPSGKSS